MHSFEGLLSDLASRARVTYALKSGKSEEKSNLTFQQVPEPTPVQARAYELVQTFSVAGRGRFCYPSGNQQNTLWDLMELRANGSNITEDCGGPWG